MHLSAIHLHATLSVLGLAALLAGGSAAQDLAVVPPEGAGAGQPLAGVVELYTSQGCSSCPPADALVADYARRPDLVTLSLPVDYWDYLGWNDTLAAPRNTERQRSYARARGDGAVYTPQVVVNGTVHVNGADTRAIDAALEAGRQKLLAGQVPVRISSHGATVLVQTGAATRSAPQTEATVWLAIVQRAAEVTIPRGENAGRTITYTNVVRELVPVGMWSGKPMQIRLARAALLRPEAEALAVLVQDGDGGPIIGAAWMPL